MRAYGRESYGFGTYGDLLLTPSVPSPPVLVAKERRKLPLGLSVEIETYDGRTFRWDDNSSDPRSRPTGLGFQTQRGDGFTTATVTLHRNVLRDYADLNLLDTARFIGADGSVAYEGRVAGTPRSIEDTHQIEVQCSGWMMYAKARPFAAIYADRSGQSWSEASLALRIANANIGNPIDSDYTPQTDTGSVSFKGQTQKPIDVNSQGNLEYFAPSGQKIAVLEYRGQDLGASISNCSASAFYGTNDDSSVMGSWSEAVAMTLDNTLRTATFGTPQPICGLRLRCSTAHTPASGNAAHRVLHRLCVYGDHGLTRRTSLVSGDPDGLFASDIIADIAQRYCPKLSTSGIQQTTYPVSQAAWFDPIFPYDAWVQMNDFHNWELAVWEGPALAFYPVDLSTYDWQVRTDDPGVRLSPLQGDTTDSFASGIVVSYQDFNSRAQILWPDVLAAAGDSSLLDTDPDNPANKQGENLWTTLQLDHSSSAGDAKQFGAIALQEFNRPKTPGSIVVGPYIKDAAGNRQPGWKVRCGQTVAITDHPNDAPRLITATSWDQSAHRLTLTLEQPASRMDAIVARMAATQQAIGV